MIVDSLRPLVRSGGHRNPRVSRDHLQASNENVLIFENPTECVVYLDFHIWFSQFIPESKGESRDGVERGDDFKAEETAKEVAEVVPLLLATAEPSDPNFLAVFIRPAKLSLSPAELGGGCCLACWRHLARRFLNQT